MADVGDAAANGGRKLFTRCCQSVSPYIFYLVGIVGIVFIALFTALLLMFLIHQLTIWMSQDPVRAFHAAQHTVQIFAAGWDVATVAYNAIREIVILILPLYNGLAMYVVQPAVFVVIEVMVLTFSGKAYNGVLSDDSLPFEGHNCVPEGVEITPQNEATAQFCGNAELYAKAIGTVRGANTIEGNATLVMSTETARRLGYHLGADWARAAARRHPGSRGLSAHSHCDHLRHLLAFGLRSVVHCVQTCLSSVPVTHPIPWRCVRCDLLGWDVHGDPWLGH